MRLIVILGLFWLAVGGVTASFAQEAAPTNNSFMTNEIYLQLPPEDQQRLIEEAEYVYTYCMGREFFEQFHDCACIAATALEERLKDPDFGRSIVSVADDIADECPNIPGAAGYAYNKCTNTYAYSMSYGLEPYCSCYARKFARLYAEAPRSFMPYIRRLGQNAASACNREIEPNPFTAFNER